MKIPQLTKEQLERSKPRRIEQSEQLRNTIREMKRDVLIIHEENQPDAYVMPRSVYDALCKKMFYLIDRIKAVEKSNEMLRNKLRLKKC